MTGMYSKVDSDSGSDSDATDVKTCPECGHTGDPVKHEQRVDRADPTNTVVVLAQCGECGYAF
jgi:ribosomal protein S27AE